ncbi:MAG: peptidase [Acidimicrobiales bacterium]|nr:peptidase [Acidimicrobiales bacterium]
MQPVTMQPLVIVPARRAAAGRVSRHPVSFAVQPSIDALRRAGAEVWILPPAELTAERARALMQRADGLCLQGGADLHPRHYRDVAADEDVSGIDELQDRSELALTLAALELGVPVLALCRGAELLNVACGGTLHDLDAGAHHPASPPGSVGVLHDVSIEPGSRLRDALGVDASSVSSMHHQAISRLGDELVVTAMTADGVIEAIERRTGWTVGVQWHPEDTAADDPTQQRLFDAFVVVCRGADAAQA